MRKICLFYLGLICRALFNSGVFVRTNKLIALYIRIFVYTLSVTCLPKKQSVGNVHLLILKQMITFRCNSLIMFNYLYTLAMLLRLWISFPSEDIYWTPLSNIVVRSRFFKNILKLKNEICLLFHADWGNRKRSCYGLIPVHILLTAI